MEQTAEGKWVNVMPTVAHLTNLIVSYKLRTNIMLVLKPYGAFADARYSQPIRHVYL